MTKEELLRFNGLFAENRRWRQEYDTVERLQRGLVADLQTARAEKTMLEIKLEQAQKDHKAMAGAASARIEELEERLHRESVRTNQALEIADNAAGSMSTISRLTMHVNELAMSLEVKLDNMNKAEAKRLR